MKTLAVIFFLAVIAMFPICADRAIASVITVEFWPTTDTPESWSYNWPASNAHESNLSVVIRRNGEVIRSTNSQVRQDTQSAVSSLSVDINTLYPQLWEKEAQISAKKNEITSYLANPQQDKSHPPYLDELVQLKEEREEIQDEIDQKTDEIINEEGSGSLGWYYVN